MTRLNWLSFWFVLPVIVSLLLARSAGAQTLEKECDPQDPEMCAQPLLVGETAPFSGQLLSPKLAITLGQKADASDLRLKLETERLNSLHKIETDYLKRVHELDNQAASQQIDLLTTRLKDAQARPWYEHPAFVAVVVCVGTIAVLYGSAYLLQTVD